MTRNKIALALLALLVIAIAWRLSGTWEPSPTGRATSWEAFDRGQAELSPLRRGDRDAGPAVDELDADTALDAVVAIVVECEPDDADFIWSAEVFREPTMTDSRQRIVEREFRGDTEFEERVPSGAVGIRIVSDGAFGPSWHAVTAIAGESVTCRVQLFAESRVRGRVVDKTGAPIVGARIVLAPATTLPHEPPGPNGTVRGPLFTETPQSVETDDAGTYVIEHVDPRRAFDCAVAHPEFAVARERGVAIDPGGETTIDFALDPAGRVTGRILDAELQPIAGVVLRLAYSDRESPVFLKWHDEGRSVTDGEGHFVFGSLSAGWKKIEAVVSAEPGLTTVGHWEVKAVPGDERALGDLVVGSALFEARITSPEGAVTSPRVTAHFVASNGAATGREAALVRIPVIPDDDGVVRIEGLPAGTVSATIREDAPRSDGRHRPRSDFGAYHDGARTAVEWMLRDLADGPVPNTVPRPDVRKLALQFEGRERGDLVLLWIDGVLEVVNSAHNAKVDFAGLKGAAIRLVVTDGDRYIEEELRLDDDVERSRFAVGDRDGHSITVRVHDDGRGLANKHVLVGGPGDGDAMGVVGRTDRSGALVVRGLPLGLPLRVSAQVGRTRSPPVPVVWRDGRATVEIDASGL